MNTILDAVRNRQVRLAPFVLALICFVLPFIQISCQGQKVASLTGLQLATGTTIEQKDPYSGSVEKREIQKDIKILAVLLCTCAAVLMACVPGRFGALLTGVAGATGFVMMLVAKTTLDNEALKEGQGMLTLEYKFGFVLTCVLLALGVVIAGVQFQKRKPPSTQ